MKSALAATALLSILGLTFPAQAENPDHLQQLLAERACQGCDLTSVSLVYTDLSRVDLSGADLSFANLNRINLTNANLRGANLSSAILYNANLTGANLQGADLRGADLRDAYLAGANLDGAILLGANLRGAVGLPSSLLTADVLYQWGLVEAERGNFQGAAEYYTRSLDQQPGIPQVYLSRSIARYKSGNIQGALSDANRAEQLYLQQGNTEGQQTAAQFAQGIIEEQEALARGPSPGKPDFLNFLGSLVTLMLRFGLP